MVDVTGLDSRACGRLVARGHNSPPDCCSVPLVLRVHFSSETTKHHPFGWCFVIGAPNRTRTCDTAVNSRVLYRLSYGGILKPTKQSLIGYLCRHRPIFPGRFQPSIFGTNELNYRVRDGNGWTLKVINTDYAVM